MNSSAQSIPTFGVGNIGVALEIDSGGYVMTGKTPTLLACPGLIAPEFNPAGGLRLTPVTISSDQVHGTYVTVGTDFVQSGPWMFQLEITDGAGTVLYTSPPQQGYVYGYIAPLS